MFTTLITSYRSFNRSIHFYLFTTLLLGLSVDGVYAVLFNLYLLRLGYNPEFIGLANSAGLFTFAFASLLAGLLGSRWGSRRMLIVGVTAVILAGTLLPLAESAPSSWQNGWIILSYMLLMGGFSFFFVSGSPFMMGSTVVEQRNAVFSIHAASSSLAAFGGSLLGGALPGLISRLGGLPLTSPAPYRYPMQLLVLLMIPAFFLVRATTEPRTDIRTKQSSVEKSGLQLRHLPLLLIATIALIRLLQVAGLGATATFINVYLDTDLLVPTARIGVLTSLSRLVGIPAALLVPSLTKRFSNITIAIAGSFGAALFILPIAFIPHWLVAGLGFIGARSMTNIRFPAFQVFALELFDSRLQSTMAGVMGMAAGLSFALMALSGGYIITQFSFQSLFLTGASITLLGTFILYVFSRRAAATKAP